MKNVFRLFRRGGIYYIEHTQTRNQQSLRTTDATEARRLLLARNETEAAPMLNLALGRTYPKVKGVVGGLCHYLKQKHYAVWCIAKRKTWKHLTGLERFDIKPVPLDLLLNRPKSYAKGENHYGCKLADQQVREIRFLALQAEGHRSIARKLAERYKVIAKSRHGIHHMNGFMWSDFGRAS